MAKIPVSKAYAKWMAEDAERLNAMAELARKVAVTLPSKEEAEKRAFCPNGEGNGVTNTCGGGSSGETANVNNSKNDKSWIDSSGTFHAMGGSGGMYREEHQEWAEKIGETVSGLFRKGWSRVNKVDDVVWVSNAEGKVPSGKQLSRLIDFGIFSGASQVVFDPGAGVKKKVLWDRSEDRAFCPTGSGGGIDNSCSSVSASDPSLKERVPFKPVGDGKNSDFIRVPSVDELTEALTGSNSSKGTKIGSAKDIPAGTPVALRIDIPAFNYSTKNMGKAIYAVTIHENKGGKSFGSPLAYEPMARLTGPVTFAAKEKEATKVATGEASKFPLATVKGNFDPSRVMPPDIDSWTPVGYDPKKAAYFYDKRTGREVMGGTDAVSVGNSVFVRIPKYGYRNAKETYRDAGFWGVEYRSADCGRDEDGKFGSGNNCQAVFHGTDADSPESIDFQVPSQSKNSWALGSWDVTRHGIFFTDSRPFASEFGKNVGEFSLSAKKVADLSPLPGNYHSALVDEFIDSLDPFGKDRELWIAAKNSNPSKAWLLFDDELGEKFTGWLKSKGFDAAKFPETTDTDKTGTTFVALDKGVVGPKKRKQSRSADCGRQDGGKFGPGNKCQEEGDGGAATAPASPSPSTPTSTKMPTAKVGDPANGTAWLSPSGVFHPVPRATPPQFRPQAPRGFMTHDQWASLHGHEGGEDGLIKAGWTRVAQSGRTLYVQTGGKPLTHSQLKSLKDQAMTAGNDEVEHDLGGDKRRTIWSKNDRSRKEEAESRADDCGRDENGRFGQDNDCQKDGQGGGDTATADKPQSKLFSKDENTQWSPASGDEPFPGASRYSDISVSGGKAVANSFDSMGIKPEDAVSLLGAPERSSVFMRPAPEFGQKFYAFSGTNTPPVFMGFEADVAGIRRGLEGTYVLGSRRNNETGKQDLVLYGNVMDVLPAVSATAERRHAAARAFYKTMVSGIENARKAGVSTVMFSAAGKAADSDRAGTFRGYTIWPRMGFDGPLPKHIVDKLPPDLSHARTLMDLHATREGTRWWAKNGEDIDVELNLADRNSPQNKVFDRFVKHFSRDRRDLPLGEGDGWLSPEDLARLDEMWAEIWDDEDILDDYDGGEQRFVVESRAFCATGVGGGIDNSCGSNESSGLFSGRLSSGEKPSEVLRSLGFSNLSRGDEFDAATASPAGIVHQFQAARSATASGIIKSLSDAASKIPEITDARISIVTRNAEKQRRAAAGNPNASEVDSLAGDCDMNTGEICIFFDASTANSVSKWLGGKSGVFSTSDPSHTVVHEFAHSLHAASMRSLLGKEIAEKGKTDRDKVLSEALLGSGPLSKDHLMDLSFLRSQVGSKGQEVIDSSPTIRSKISSLSSYATTHPFEAYAEYWTAVSLGKMKPDSDLDAFCDVIYAPRPTARRARK